MAIIGSIRGRLKVQNKVKIALKVKRLFESLVTEQKTKTLKISFKNDDPQANVTSIRNGAGTASTSTF